MMNKSVLLFLLFFALILNLNAQVNVDLINCTKDEQAPVLHPNGNFLFFTRANDSLNVGGHRDKGDIWMSELTGNTWGAPINIGAPINNKGYNSVAGFSPDGKIIYIHHKYDFNGRPARSGGMSYSYKKGDNWSLPKIYFIQLE